MTPISSLNRACDPAPPAQAEEERRAAEEAAARAAAAAQAAALSSADPVVRLRAVLAERDAPSVVKELRGMTVDGGVAGEPEADVGGAGVGAGR